MPKLIQPSASNDLCILGLIIAPYSTPKNKGLVTYFVRRYNPCVDQVKKWPGRGVLKRLARTYLDSDLEYESASPYALVFMVKSGRSQEQRMAFFAALATHVQV